MENKCTWLTLLPETIFGAEDDENQQESSNEDEGNESEQENEDAGKAPKDSEHDDADDPKVKGLKAALETERKAAREGKAAQAELKKLKKAEEDRVNATKTEVEQAKIRAEKAEEKATKLALGFRTTNINSQIRTAARELGFIDEDDALNGVDRSKISVEQDDDDPSEVSVDSSTVLAVVKALATKKPHFLKGGTDDDQPSGSQFGGKKTKKQTSEDEYRSKYPSL